MINHEIFENDGCLSFSYLVALDRTARHNEKTGQPGKPNSHQSRFHCSELARYGYLERSGKGGYRLTSKGDADLQEFRVRKQFKQQAGNLFFKNMIEGLYGSSI